METKIFIRYSKMCDDHKKLRYYTKHELSQHCTENDCWVALNGEIFDITSLIAEYKDSPLKQPLIQAAGTDISHWFDEFGDVKKCVNPETGLKCYYTPMGRFIHIPSYDPSCNYKPDYEVPWWKDKKYVIGKLSKKTRKIRIVNTLTHHEHVLEVCSEETLEEILERYLKYNAHAGSYTWKRLGRELDMDKTLDENGIIDEDDEFEELGIHEEYYIPAIYLYFNDDLTVG